MNQSLQIQPRKFVLAITGRRSDSPKYSEQIDKAAFEVGKLAARLGLVVLTGGLTGVMESAARGAKSIGGHTVGILPGFDHGDANPYIDFVLPSGLGIARNIIIASACDFMVALPGGTGTLEEICFALDFKRPVISFGSWSIDGVSEVPIQELVILEEKLKTMIANKKNELK